MAQDKDKLIRDATLNLEMIVQTNYLAAVISNLMPYHRQRLTSYLDSYYKGKEEHEVDAASNRQDTVRTVHPGTGTQGTLAGDGGQVHEDVHDSGIQAWVDRS